MTNTKKAPRPSAAQFRFLLALIAAGGRGDRWVGAGRPASIVTLINCEQAGWITGHPVEYVDGEPTAAGYSITPDGILAAINVDQELVKAAYATAAAADDEAARWQAAADAVAPAFAAALDAPLDADRLAALVELDEADRR